MIAAAALAATIAVAPLRHVSFDGRDRTYRVYRPPHLSRTHAVPLVVMLHGGFGSSAQAERAYHWDEAAAKDGFVVLYPDGVGRSWNAGTCCGMPARQQIDDVGFLTNAIERVERDEHIDPARIVVAGMSNGAMMAYRMACEAPISLYGIASVAGTMTSSCDAPKPTNVVEIHGDADRNVPYDGGTGRGFARVNARSVDSVIARWSAIDGCHHAAPLARGPVSMTTYGCDDKRIVFLVTVHGAGHQWPGGRPPGPAAVRLAHRLGIAGLDEPSTALDATATIVHAMHLAPF
ncbi:MAG TPA: alpha/beta fold hydrolase [Candidatus Aquilonibacter sp.]|nr:alpha/beta fold hydrolase [Candidatus Aquilonibacter sp.]